VLASKTRDIFERQAQTAKEKYYAELAEYKKTSHYAMYQEYLVDFKAKHATPRTGMIFLSLTVFQFIAHTLQKGNEPSWSPKPVPLPAAVATTTLTENPEAGPHTVSPKTTLLGQQNQKPAPS